MADEPVIGLDFSDEDIPVIDRSGRSRMVKGSSFVDADIPIGPLPPPSRSSVSVAAPAVPKKDTFVTVQPEDVEEIKQAEAKAERAAPPPAIKTAEQILDGMVDEAVGNSGVVFENDDLKKRFRNLISLYFRDLRDSLETKSKLTMPTVSGGMGMADEKAAQVMALMASKATEFRAATSAKTEQEKQQYVQAQNEKALGAAEREALQEKDVLDKRFAHLVQKTGVGAAPAKTAGTVPPRPVPPPQSLPKVIPVVSLDKKPVEFAPPNLPVAPSAPPVQASSQAAPSSQPVPSSQPTVSDIKFTPKLTGPVEELRALTLKDFRRLSKDPAEATLKIKDKIDLLEDQGFELKTQGIKAWQDSESNRLYLDMLRKSLEGKPVADVINELEAKGESVLTKAEFDAIMALNRQLRFG